MIDYAAPSMWWAAEPSKWAAHAGRLCRSAVLLWTPLQRMFEVRAEAADKQVDASSLPGYEVDAGDHQYAFFLVAGAALETMLKAAAIQLTVNSDGPGAVLTSSSELRPMFATHDLERLAVMAGLDLRDTEAFQLRRFNMFTVWAGRYPIPKRPAREKEPQGEGWFDYILPAPDDLVAFRRVYQIAQEAYEHHLRATVRKAE